MEGQQIILQGLREGYVFELIGKGHALQSIIDATLRATQIIYDLKREASLPQEEVELLAIHNRNNTGVSLVPGTLIEDFDD